MPQEIVRYISKNFNNVYGSPYSSSFYSEPGQTWNYSPKNQIRISDHWNFWSRDYKNPFSVDEFHAETNKKVENNTHWTIAKKNENNVYEVIMSLPKLNNASIFKNKLENWLKKDLLTEKNPNEILYKFQEKIEHKKRIEEQEKEEEKRRLFLNSLLKSTSKKVLNDKIEKYLFVSKIRKNSDDYNFLQDLKLGKTFFRPIYYKGVKRNAKPINNTNSYLYILKNILKLRTEQGNDAPRNGKEGNYIQIITKIK